MRACGSGTRRSPRWWGGTRHMRCWSISTPPGPNSASTRSTSAATASTPHRRATGGSPISYWIPCDAMIQRLLASLFNEQSAAPERDAPAVEARDLRKRYRSGTVAVDALRGIDLRIARGEFVAIVGPSGCGKTSLLNCLAGLETDYEGEVLLSGMRLRNLSDARRARLRARLTGF